MAPRRLVLSLMSVLAVWCLLPCVLAEAPLGKALIKALAHQAKGKESGRVELDYPVWRAKYIVIIDAGSSGSRVHVHPYVDKHPVPDIQPSENLKVRPGLSSYEKKPEESAEVVANLLQFAKKRIPMAQWAETPIFLFATAGLRSIPPEAAEDILTVCRRQLDASPFMFKHPWASVIPGTKEGIFGWTAVNYLMGTFNSKSAKSVGVIEMGGASMQLSFVPDDESEVDGSKLFPVTIGSRKFKLYTHSYLGYGLEAAQRRFLELNQASVSKDGNPCYYQDTPQTAVGFNFGKPAGNYERCAKLMTNMFDKSTCAEVVVCSFNGVYQPKIKAETFVAIENFYYTTEFFQLDDNDDAFDLLPGKSKDMCNTDWDVLTSKFKHERKQDLAKYCFSSVFISKVLSDGLGIDFPAKNTEVVKRINGVGIDWAMGAALYQLTNDRKDIESVPTVVLDALQSPSESEAQTPFSISSLCSPTDRSFLAVFMFALALSIALYHFICWSRVKAAGYAPVPQTPTVSGVASPLSRLYRSTFDVKVNTH